MDFKRLFSVLSMVFILAAFAGAGIDLDDPLQTGQQSYVPTTPSYGSTYIEGNLYTSGGQILQNGKVSVAVGATVYSAYSDFQGYFRLELPFELPTMKDLKIADHD